MRDVTATPPFKSEEIMARSKKTEKKVESAGSSAHLGNLADLEAQLSDRSKPVTVDRSKYDKTAFAEVVMKLKTSTSKLEYNTDGTVTFHWYSQTKPLESHSFSRALENL